MSSPSWTAAGSAVVLECSRKWRGTRCGTAQWTVGMLARTRAAKRTSAAETTLMSFLDLKRQQASLLFAAWDDDNTGCIPCRQLCPFLSALFPSDTTRKEAAEMLFTLQEIREAFVTTLGRTLSPNGHMTLGELLAVMDALWASPARRTRMLQACLLRVFTAVSNAQKEVAIEALAEACRYANNASFGSAEVEFLLRSVGAAASRESMDFDAFCALLFPLLHDG